MTCRQSMCYLNQCWFIATWQLRTNVLFLEIWTVPFMNMHLKIPSAKWKPVCFCLNVSKGLLLPVTVLSTVDRLHLYPRLFPRPRPRLHHLDVALRLPLCLLFHLCLHPHLCRFRHLYLRLLLHFHLPLVSSLSSAVPPRRRSANSWPPLKPRARSKDATSCKHTTMISNYISIYFS